MNVFDIEMLPFLPRRFLRGPNFMPWFQRRRAVAEQEQHKLWRQARMNTDIQQFISKRSELEIVDSFNAIERHFLEEIQVFFPLISCFLLGYAFIFSHFLRKHALTKNTYKSLFDFEAFAAFKRAPYIQNITYCEL